MVNQTHASDHEIILKIENLTVRLPKGADRENAIEDVSFSVDAGEIVCVVGESGSGKSTVARCILRLIDPSGGEILINGKDIAGLGQGELRPYRDEIQMVFQDPYRSLNPRRTVGQSIVEGPMNFGVSLAGFSLKAGFRFVRPE